ncbi:adenylate/guanylate cyclase domain-containing protein [bacterium]|nr:adenylate/guanylate cyclase domain-containing protein [bacterium]
MKIFTSIWMVIVFAVVLTGIRVDNSDTVKILRYKTWDKFQQIQPRADVSDRVVVVNITESDIKKYGQWPWPRHILAMFHAGLSDSGAVLVNYNVLFAEADRMGGKEYLKSFPMTEEIREQLGTILTDTDGIFSYALKESNNAVLMMSVKNESDNIIPKTTKIIQKGDVLPWLYEYEGIVPPLTLLTVGAKGIGVNVTSPEPDAVVRKMPVLIRVGDKIYPSMLLENIRIVNRSKRIKVVAKEYGINEVLVSKQAGIPVNHNAEMYINYADPSQYTQLSVEQVFSREHDDKIKGRIVVVGMDAAGLSVLKYTPHGLTTDQMITAQALDTTMTGDYLFRTPQADTYEIVFLAFLLLLLILVLPRTSVLLAVPLLFFIEGGIAYGAFMAYTNKGFLVDPSWTMLSVFLIWSHSVYNNFATQSRLRQQIKKQFEHYLDPGMVKKLQKDPSLLKLGGEKRDMTFLFCDIRGFTPISEKYKGNPEGLTKLINRFLTRMTDVIIANGGTIDKFMGDCIMAFWNAPIEDGEHEEHAVQAAIDMQNELLKLNQQLAVEGLPTIAIGIGINTGEALVGNMGSDQRFDYSVIGDAVNLAARLESSSKTLGKTLVIGEDTVKAAKLNYDFEYIDQITVKGKTEEIKVYTHKH